MERWAANTLRTLGIILTAGFVLLTSLFLLLLAMCASQGGIGGTKHPEQVVPYVTAAVVVLLLGIWLIAWLARGILRSKLVAEPLPAGVAPAAESVEGHSAVPLHLSPASLRAINLLVLAMAAQIAVSAVVWIINQSAFWRAPHDIALHNWFVATLVPYILYHVPYAILIYILLKRPDRRAFAYCIAVPAVLVLQSLFSLGLYTHYLAHYQVAFLLLVVPWATHIVILVLAYQAIQQVGIHPQPSSLIVAAIVMFIFFSVIQGATPFLYRIR
jgi:hypothetical protein